MTDKNLETRLQRAQEAEQFLGSDIVKRLVLRTKDRYFIQWANTKAEDMQKREQLHAQYRGLLDLVNELRSYVLDGEQIRRQEENSNGGT